MFNGRYVFYSETFKLQLSSINLHNFSSSLFRSLETCPSRSCFLFTTSLKFFVYFYLNFLTSLKNESIKINFLSTLNTFRLKLVFSFLKMFPPKKTFFFRSLIKKKNFFFFFTFLTFCGFFRSESNLKFSKM